MSGNGYIVNSIGNSENTRSSGTLDESNRELGLIRLRSGNLK